MYNKIKVDMVQALKDGDKDRQSLLKVLVSDIQRDPYKDYCDAKVIGAIKQTIKALSDPHMRDASPYTAQHISYLEEYLPKAITDSEIIEFLDTLDFLKFKNKMQAVGEVTKHFPDGSVNGGDVKNLVGDYII
jgi:uncharacterized protein YqeY